MNKKEPNWPSACPRYAHNYQLAKPVASSLQTTHKFNPLQHSTPINDIGSLMATTDMSTCLSFQQLSLNNNRWIILDSCTLQAEKPLDPLIQKKRLINSNCKSLKTLGSWALHKQRTKLFKKNQPPCQKNQPPCRKNPHSLFEAADLTAFPPNINNWQNSGEAAQPTDEEKKAKTKTIFQRTQFTEGLSIEKSRQEVPKKQASNKKAYTARMQAKKGDLENSPASYKPPQQEQQKEGEVGAPSKLSQPQHGIQPQAEEAAVQRQTRIVEKPQISAFTLETQVLSSFQQATMAIEYPAELIAQLYDPASLLQAGFGTPPLTDNPYDYFCLWGNSFPLSPAQHSASDNPPHCHGAKQKQAESLLQKRVGSIFQQQTEIKGQPIKNKQQAKQSQQICQQYHKRTGQAIRPQLQLPPRTFQEDKLKEIQAVPCLANTQELTPGNNKRRSLTTKQTENVFLSENRLNFASYQSQQAKLQPRQAQIPSQCTPIQHSKAFAEDANSSAYFNIRSLLQPQDNIHLINIPPTEQTALFPLHLADPVYIKNSPELPDSRNYYRNEQLIGLLNLFLRVQPKQLQIMFQHHQNQYSCRVYEGAEGRGEGEERRRVAVDGLFPFSENFYPLYGSVQQYIWFSVLAKCLAQLAGSYKGVQKVSFRQIYAMVTSEQLQSAVEWLKSGSRLKRLRLLLRLCRSQATFLIAKDQNSFYKIESAVYVKSRSEMQEEMERKVINPASSAERAGHKALDAFLSRKKALIGQERTGRNSRVHLVGPANAFKLPLRSLLLRFEVYCASGVLKKAVNAQQ